MGRRSHPLRAQLAFEAPRGRAREVESRPSAFDEAALQAIRQWVFTPARANGQPVAVWMRIPVVFTLD
jgi:protein TonB